MDKEPKAGSEQLPFDPRFVRQIKHAFDDFKLWPMLQKEEVVPTVNQYCLTTLFIILDLVSSGIKPKTSEIVSIPIVDEAKERIRTKLIQTTGIKPQSTSSGLKHGCEALVSALITDYADL